jgi:hypothetical protein
VAREKSAAAIIAAACPSSTCVATPQIDYLELVNADTRPLETVQPNSAIALAVFSGRLG